ncbi:hypothetical protein [Streptomyces radicis]|uniref:hypothetical protein n=1 Tax=Streptomyces radicis TaxID=1750517 RepID=UPI001E518BE5|nr:hypothetical protein [Streptomyces radicis]
MLSIVPLACGAPSGAASGERLVARKDPPRISANAAVIVPLNGSFRKIIPAPTATAGLT